MAKLKLDENLGRTSAQLLRSYGHDVATVQEQRMCSVPDRKLIGHCRAEGRCLVTLDLDFSSPLAFPPDGYCGIVVLRLPAAPSLDDLIDSLRTLSHGLSRESISGQLWIVQPGRIRAYQGHEGP